MTKTNVRETTGRLDRGNGTELAWARLDGRSPTVVFLPGFRSDMTGDKATAPAAATSSTARSAPGPPTRWPRSMR